jgi:hypothetical protein
MSEVLHIKNGNKSLVVVFSAYVSRPDFKGFTYQEVFKRLGLSGHDLLFLRDSRNQWFNRGVKGLGENVDEVARALAEIASGYKVVQSFGSSMGGYASLLFAHKCGFSTWSSVCPQTFLAKPFPRYAFYHRGSYIDLQELDRREFSPPGRIVLGDLDLFDIYQINRLHCDPQVWFIKGCSHDVPTFLRAAGVLDPFVRSLVENRRWAFDGRVTLYRENPVYLNEKGGNSDLAVYIESKFHKRFAEAKRALSRLTEKYGSWFNSDGETGFLLVLAKEAAEAEPYLRRSIERYPLDDKPYRFLFDILRSRGDEEGAERMLISGCKVNRASFADVLTPPAAAG